MEHRCCYDRGCGHCSYCYGECYECNGLRNFYEENELGYSLIISDDNGINVNYFKEYSRALSELNKYFNTNGKNADEIINHTFHYYNYHDDDIHSTYLLSKIEYENN